MKCGGMVTHAHTPRPHQRVRTCLYFYLFDGRVGSVNDVLHSNTGSARRARAEREIEIQTIGRPCHLNWLPLLYCGYPIAVNHHLIYLSE